MNFDFALRMALLGALAAALFIPYRWGGRLILCQATIVGLGAYVFTAMTTEAQLGLVPSFAAAALLGGLFGAALTVLLHSLSDAAAALVSFLLALAGVEIYQNAESLTGGYSGMAGMQRELDLATTYGSESVAAVALAIVCFALVVLGSHLKDREFGRAVRALRDDYMGAHLDGIRPYEVELYVYTVFGATSGLVGAVWAIALPSVDVGYFDVMELGLPIVLACALFRGDSPLLGVLGAVVVFCLDEFTQKLPVPAEMKADIPLLTLGCMYVAVMLVSPSGISMQPLKDLVSRVRMGQD